MASARSSFASMCVLCPAVLGNREFFLDSLRILNQDHTSQLSDDKRSFGQFCQQAQLQNCENKDVSIKLSFDFVLLLPSLFLCHLSLVFCLCLLSLSDVPVSSPFFLFYEQEISPFLSLSFSISLPLSFFPSEEINTISPPCEKTNTDNPGCAAGV